jgi:cytochrome c oxidase assembly protein subunit 16
MDPNRKMKSKLFQSSNFKNFIPFVVLTVGAFYLVERFRKFGYQYGKSKGQVIYKEQLEKAGMKPTDYQAITAESLQDEYEKMMKKLDINNWENKRVPRPWEENFDKDKK